jgi:hypothetical protein
LGGARGQRFVELARLIVLFRVGLEQLFVGVALLGFPVGLSRFCLFEWQGKCGVELARLIIFFRVGLAQLFVWLS